MQKETYLSILIICLIGVGCERIEFIVSCPMNDCKLDLSIEGLPRLPLSENDGSVNVPLRLKRSAISRPWRSGDAITGELYPGTSSQDKAATCIDAKITITDPEYAIATCPLNVKISQPGLWRLVVKGKDGFNITFDAQETATLRLYAYRQVAYMPMPAHTATSTRADLRSVGPVFIQPGRIFWVEQYGPPGESPLTGMARADMQNGKLLAGETVLSGFPIGRPFGLLSNAAVVDVALPDSTSHTLNFYDRTQNQKAISNFSFSTTTDKALVTTIGNSTDLAVWYEGGPIYWGILDEASQKWTKKMTHDSTLQYNGAALMIQHFVGDRAAEIRMLLVTRSAATLEVKVDEFGTATWDAKTLPDNKSPVLQDCLASRLKDAGLAGRPNVLFTIADMDRDGLPDLVYATIEASSTDVYYLPYADPGPPSLGKDEECAFGAQKRLTSLPVMNLTRLAVGDVNQDGLPDIAATEMGSLGVKVFLAVP